MGDKALEQVDRAKKKVMTSEEVVKQLLSPMPQRRKVLKPAPHVNSDWIQGEDSLLFGKFKKWLSYRPGTRLVVDARKFSTSLQPSTFGQKNHRDFLLYFFYVYMQPCGF